MGLIERKWTLIVDSNDHIRGYVAGTNRIVSGMRMDDREVDVVPAETLRGAVDLTANEAAMLEVLAAEEIARHEHPPHDLMRARDKLRERAERGQA